jgi:hypothetical protein
MLVTFLFHYGNVALFAYMKGLEINLVFKVHP